MQLTKLQRLTLWLRPFLSGFNGAKPVASPLECSVQAERSWELITDFQAGYDSFSHNNESKLVAK